MAPEAKDVVLKFKLGVLRRKYKKKLREALLGSDLSNNQAAFEEQLIKVMEDLAAVEKKIEAASEHHGLRILPSSAYLSDSECEK